MNTDECAEMLAASAWRLGVALAEHDPDAPIIDVDGYRVLASGVAWLDVRQVYGYGPRLPPHLRATTRVVRGVEWIPCGVVCGGGDTAWRGRSPEVRAAVAMIRAHWPPRPGSTLYDLCPPPPGSEEAQSPWLRRREAARHYGVSTSTIDAWRRVGKVKARKAAGTRHEYYCGKETENV